MSPRIPVDAAKIADFCRRHHVGRLIQMEEELSGILRGHKVDLVTPKFLNHRIRDRVLAGAQVQYAEG
jgi:predicted nucleotidyltransferase